MHPAVPAAGGGALDEFLGAFHPLTPLDRQLMLAAVLTVFWGGPPGKRPAFLLTGPKADPMMGRGLGKTTFCQVVADELAGGYLDIRPTEDVGRIKTRALTLEARTKRVFMLDNVKTYKFSWADFEGFLTSTVISGHQLFHGDGARPNTLTWLITLNNPSLSADIGRRAVPIYLARPAFSTGWEAAVRAFARDHRGAILADVRDRLMAPPLPVPGRLGFGTWEQGVLARVGDPAGCTELILERRRALDDDQGDRDLVLAGFRDRISASLKRDGGTADADGARAFFSSRRAAVWLGDAMNEKYNTPRANALIQGLGLAELEYVKHNGHWGFRWTGPAWKGTEKDRIAVIDRGGAGLLS
jgi:hypothetical protein